MANTAPTVRTRTEHWRTSESAGGLVCWGHSLWPMYCKSVDGRPYASAMASSGSAIR